MWTPSLETLTFGARVVTTSGCWKHSRDSREGSSLFLFALHNSQARTVRHVQTRPKKQVFSSHLCLLVAATETTVLSSEFDGKRASEFRCIHDPVGQAVIEVERVDGAGLVICNVTSNLSAARPAPLTGLVLGRAVAACSTQVCGVTPVHLAVAVRRPRGARLKNSRFVTVERKSWVPLITATQRLSPSATHACVVASWHVSTFVTPEKYSQDHVGTEFSQWAAPASLAYWMGHASSPSAMEGLPRETASGTLLAQGHLSLFGLQQHFTTLRKENAGISRGFLPQSLVSNFVE